jgi:hypothetical protein
MFLIRVKETGITQAVNLSIPAAAEFFFHVYCLVICGRNFTYVCSHIVGLQAQKLLLYKPPYCVWFFGSHASCVAHSFYWQNGMRDDVPVWIDHGALDKCTDCSMAMILISHQQVEV